MTEKVFFLVFNILFDLSSSSHGRNVRFEVKPAAA